MTARTLTIFGLTGGVLILFSIYAGLHWVFGVSTPTALLCVGAYVVAAVAIAAFFAIGSTTQ